MDFDYVDQMIGTRDVAIELIKSNFTKNNLVLKNLMLEIRRLYPMVYLLQYLWQNAKTIMIFNRK